MKRLALLFLALSCASPPNDETSGIERSNDGLRRVDCVREALASGFDQPNPPFSQTYANEVQTMALAKCPCVARVVVPAEDMSFAVSQAAELYRTGADFASATFADAVDAPGRYVAVGFYYPNPGDRKCR